MKQGVHCIEKSVGTREKYQWIQIIDIFGINSVALVMIIKLLHSEVAFGTREQYQCIKIIDMFSINLVYLIINGIVK